MNNYNPTHYAFSDESKHNLGRYRSIGMISMPVTNYTNIENNLMHILSKYRKSIKSFKWTKLKNKNTFNAISDMINLVMENCRENNLRIDVLIWDIEDSRHRIPGRNDSSNLARMYYHLFENVLKRRWEEESIWDLYPDQNTAIDWSLLEDILVSKRFKVKRINSSFAFEMFNRSVQINESTPTENPLIQIADIFAGMGCYSWENFEHFKEWERLKSGQKFLIPPKNTKELSRRDKHRCPILKQVHEDCKSRKYQISLSSTKGLYSNNPQKPINFWLYTPQSDKDQAPTD